MLKTRIITALLLLAVFIPMLFYSSTDAWAILMLIITSLAAYEWAKLVNTSNRVATCYAVVLMAIGAVSILLMRQKGADWFVGHSITVFAATLLFWGIAVPVLMSRMIVIASRPLWLLIGAVLLLPFWLAFVCGKIEGAWTLLMLLVTIWISDTAAYFSGKQFGRNKLAPSISPGKTWEGVAGALFAVALFAAVLYFSGLKNNLIIFPLLIATAVLGIFGDLFESLVKRQMSKKDSGQILPGHGGILDRVDGVLPSLPIAVLMINLLHFYQ